jgi:hypothetical protein
MGKDLLLFNLVLIINSQPNRSANSKGIRQNQYSQYAQ